MRVASARPFFRSAIDPQESAHEENSRFRSAPAHAAPGNRAGQMSGAEKQRIIDQLGPVAQNRFGEDDSGEAFGAYWASLTVTQRNNPRERREGFDVWHAQVRDAASPSQGSLDLRARSKAQEFLATLTPRPLGDRTASKPEPRRGQNPRDKFGPEMRRGDAARPAGGAERPAAADASRILHHKPGQYRGLLIRVLGPKAEKRFKDEKEAQRFAKFLRTQDAHPGDPKAIEDWFPEFHDQSRFGCRTAMQNAFPQDFKAKFPDEEAINIFFRYMCANRLHAGSAPQEVQELYRRRTEENAAAEKVLIQFAREQGDYREFTPSEVSRYVGVMTKGQHNPLAPGEAAIKDFLKKLPPSRASYTGSRSKGPGGQAPRDAGRLKEARRRDAARTKPRGETRRPNFGVDLLDPRLAAAKDQFINSLGRVSQTTFKGKHADEAFEKFIGYLAEHGKDRTDERQAADGFNAWHARRDVLQDPGKYHEILKEALGAARSKRFKSAKEAASFGRFIANHGDDPADVAKMELYLEQFRDQSFPGCLTAMKDAFPQDFKTKFPDDRAVQVFFQNMRANDLHAGSTPQEVQKFYRDEADKVATAARMLTKVARQGGEYREFTQSDVSFFIGLMNKKRFALEDPRAAAAVLPQFLLYLSQPRASHAATYPTDPGAPDLRDDVRSEIRGRSERSDQREADLQARLNLPDLREPDLRESRFRRGTAYRPETTDRRKPLSSRRADYSPPRRKASTGAKDLSEHDWQILRERETWDQVMGPAPLEQGPVPLDQGPVPWDADMAPAPLGQARGEEDIGPDELAQLDLNQMPLAEPAPGAAVPFLGTLNMESPPRSPNTDWPMGTPEAASPPGTPEVASEDEPSSE